MAPKNGRWTTLDHAKEDDDLLSYLFVDLGLFRKYHDKERRISRKFNRAEFRTSPGVNWDTYLDILRMVKTGQITAQEGSVKLLKKGPFNTLLKRKRGQEEFTHLVTHVDRYMELYKPDCQFQIFQVNRFKSLPNLKGKGKATSIVEATSESAVPPIEPVASGIEDTLERLAPAFPEGSSAPPSPAPSSSTSTPNKSRPVFGEPLDLGVKSLKAYKVHEPLRLFGSGASMTTEEHDALQDDTSDIKGDFSVLHSTAKGCFQLFLGPGRFVNHDCNPNVELIRSGQRLSFKAIRPIEPNDELLTFYGKHYFGQDNAYCLCTTCKRNRKGAYARPAKPGKVAIPEDPNVRKTRSGQQPKVTSLRKTVHKANLARTTVSITQGSRKSARTVTQLASTSSIENARKAIRRESKSGATRKRKRNDWSSDEEQEDTRRKIRAKKARSTRKKQSTGSDSSLTDIDDFGHQVVTEVTTVETSTIETTVEGTVEEAADIEETASALDDVVIIAESHANSSPDSMLKAEDAAASPVYSTPQELRTRSLTPSTSVIGDIDAIAAIVPELESSLVAPSDGTPDSHAGSQEPSNSVEEMVDGLPNPAAKLGVHLAALADGAKTAIFRSFGFPPIASDAASLASQTSSVETEEEQNNQSCHQ